MADGGKSVALPGKRSVWIWGDSFATLDVGPMKPDLAAEPVWAIRGSTIAISGSELLRERRSISMVEPRQRSDGSPDPTNSVLIDLYGNDCADVSQQVSDGRCEDVLNCCFTYMTIAEPGHPSVEQCACVLAPMNIGVSSCEAAAAQGGGKVVNICPQYASSNEVPF